MYIFSKGKLNSDNKYIDNLIILEFNIDKIKDSWYNGDKEFNFVAALDLEEKELDKVCEGDEYMELFEKEVKRLNEDQKFTAFMSDEEEAEKLRKTLISEAKTEGIKSEKIKIAKNMLENNMSKEVISKITGLSIAEIEALK